MSMSSDRVHFELDLYNLEHASRVAYKQTFGVEPPPSRHHGAHKITIICRPSQFARFLIYRNEAGGRNLFKELNPRLEEANEEKVLDLSSRPRVRE